MGIVDAQQVDDLVAKIVAERETDVVAGASPDDECGVAFQHGRIPADIGALC